MTQNTEQNERTRDELPWNGYPENPEVGGFHWLKQNGCGRLIPFEWDSCDEYWLFDDNSDGIPDEVAKLFKYHGPCLPPKSRAAAEERAKAAQAIHVVFDGMPGPEMPRFVECENSEGFSVRAGEWEKRSDGLCELVIPRHLANVAALEARVKVLEEALASLETAAKHVYLRGAVTGSQWPKLGVAISCARAALTREGEQA